MRFTIPLLLLTSVLGLAACGSSAPSTDGSTVASGSGAGDTNKAVEFSSCMRSHGVSNFPDPTGGQLNLQVQKTPNGTSVNGAEVNGPAFQSALQHCRSYLPNGGHPSAAQVAKAKAQALAMSRCMRSHGVPNFPDPKFQSGPGGGLGIGIQLNGSGIDPSSPAFQAAQKDCAGIIGAPKVTAKVPG
jgi:hypothetical protein